MSHLTFNVGPNTFTVLVAAEDLHNGDGTSPALGRIAWGERLVLIAGGLPRSRREEVLLHELWHAYAFAFPPPPADPRRKNEKFVEWATSVTRDIIAQYHAQGGSGAVEALPLTIGRVPERMVLKPEAPRLEHSSTRTRKAGR